MQPQNSGDPFGLDYDNTNLQSRLAGLDLDATGSDSGGSAPQPAAPLLPPFQFDPTILAPVASVAANLPFDLLAHFLNDCGFRLDAKQEAACRSALEKALAHSLANVEWGQYVLNPWGAYALTTLPIAMGKYLQHQAAKAQKAQRAASASTVWNGATAGAGAGSSSAASQAPENLPNLGEEQDYADE